jgi:hypothetical protein
MRVLCALCILTVVNVACESSPTWATRVRPPASSDPSVTQPPPPQPPASVELRNARVIVSPLGEDRPEIVYRPEFDIVETGGSTYAWIYSVRTRVADGSSDLVDENCWGSPMRLGPRGTIRVDGGLGYCAPGVVSATVVTHVSVEVAFADASLRPDRVIAVLPVTRP